MTKPKEQLNRKQQLFFDLYIKYYDAQKAYIEAGYDAKAAYSAAFQLLSHPTIKTKLEEHRANQRAQFRDIHLDMVAKLRDIIDTDTDDFATWDADAAKIIPSAKIPKSKKRAVSEISFTTKIFTTRGGDVDRQLTSKIKLTDKIKAMELLAKITGIMKDDAEDKTAGVTRNVVVFKTRSTDQEVESEYDKPSSAR